MNESLHGRHRKQHTRLPAATRLAEGHDTARVAAEVLDVVANPFEGSHEVQHPGHAGGRELLLWPTGICQAQEPERSQSMRDRHHHHITRVGELSAVIEGCIARADGETTSMNTEHDGAANPVFEAWSPDVQTQTILPHAPLSHREIELDQPSIGMSERGQSLRTNRAVPEALA